MKTTTALVAPVILASLTWIHAQSQSAPVSKTADECSVSGIVVDSVSGAPLGKADISLEPLGSGFSSLSARFAVKATTRSDSEGRFKMVGLKPGIFSLRARRSGYLKGAYGSRRPESTGARLELKAGQSLTGLRIRLMPGAAISGSVHDIDGELLEGMPVRLIRTRYDDGIPALRTVAATETDDRGEYRFHDLEDGRYYVAVEPSVSTFGEVDRSADARVPQPPVWTLYPGAQDLALATPIEVISGRRVSGVDINLVRSPLFRVSGRVEGQKTDAPPLVVELTDTKNASLRRTLQTPAPTSGDLSFEAFRLDPTAWASWAPAACLLS